MPMKEAMIAAASEWWEESVSDRDGKTWTRHHSGTRVSRGEYMCKKAAQEACEGAMGDFIDGAKVILQKQLTDNIVAAVAKMKR